MVMDRPRKNLQTAAAISGKPIAGNAKICATSPGPAGQSRFRGKSPLARSRRV
jgi:hypothetical protein